MCRQPRRNSKNPTFRCAIICRRGKKRRPTGSTIMKVFARKKCARLSCVLRSTIACVRRQYLWWTARLSNGLANNETSRVHRSGCSGTRVDGRVGANADPGIEPGSIEVGDVPSVAGRNQDPVDDDGKIDNACTSDSKCACKIAWQISRCRREVQRASPSDSQVASMLEIG